MSVSDSTPAEAGNLTGGKHDYRLFARQGGVDRLDVQPCAAAGHVSCRKETGAQRFDCHQQIIGDDFDIGAHFMHQLQQGQAIERADRVIGDDNHLAEARSVFPLPAGHRIAEMEIVENLFDKLDTVQVRVLFDKSAGCR